MVAVTLAVTAGTGDAGAPGQEVSETRPVPSSSAGDRARLIKGIIYTYHKIGDEAGMFPRVGKGDKHTPAVYTMPSHRFPFCAVK